MRAFHRFEIIDIEAIGLAGEKASAASRDVARIGHFEVSELICSHTVYFTGLASTNRMKHSSCRYQ